MCRVVLACYLVMLGAVLQGCATRQASPSVAASQDQLNLFLADKPTRLRPGYAAILKDDRRNFVLNHMRLGLDAFQLGHLGLATASFDKALLGIETVYADNPQARKARSLWYEEGTKDFKGEPYERAMAYYYRGLLYMLEDDYENARTCFKSGALQDCFAEEEQRRCDFALMVFLEGWTSQTLEDLQLAEDAFRELKKLRPDFTPRLRESNVLLVVETGYSPRKVSDGVGHGELKFRKGRNFAEAKVELLVDGGSNVTLYPMEDVAWQAMTRGGRPVDKILEGQVVFKKTHEATGTVLTDVANETLLLAPLFPNAGSEMQDISAALGLVGLAEMAISSKARPHADTRYWDNLPDAVHVYTLKLSPGEHSLCIKFLERSGQEIGDLRKTLQVQIPEEKAVLIWERSRYQIYSDQVN